MGQRESRPRAPVPDRIGRYEVLLPIGSGGMGVVYLARRHGMGGFTRDVALKVMHAHHREAAAFGSAFIEEAKIAGRIRHPNVVPVLDVGVEDAGVYLVMDYVEGDSLAGLQRASRDSGATLPARIGLRVLVDALAGLHAAHELTDEGGRPVALIHRDFSPQNILVGVDGMSRLTDFGVAKARTNLEQTNVGLLKGKLRYMSPEQVRCDPIDRRCDIWAAGVVAWELLSGRRLYASKHDAATMLQVVAAAPPRLRTIRPELSVGLERAVASALQLDVRKRCPTAKQLADQITEAARQADCLADREAVAEFVGSVAGSALKTRRQQISQVRRLREEITAIRSDAVPAEGSTSSDVVPSPAVEAEDLSPVRIAAKSARRDDGPESETAVTRRVSAPMGERTPSALRREEITDVQAVTDAVHHPAHRVGRFLPSLIVVLALVAGFVVVQECTRSTGPETSAAAGPSPTSALGGGRPSARAKKRSSNVTLTVHADLPIAVLRVGEREFVIEQPTREVAVPLIGTDQDRALRVEAESEDGGQASADLAAGDTSVRLQFPAPAVTATPPNATVARPTAKEARPTATATRPAAKPSPAPLATNPYLRDNR